jgi:hypothetical protein
VDDIRDNVEAGFAYILSGTQMRFSFIQTMVFFGPLLGLALGFDAINKEFSTGTLSILLGQPIFRDSVINGKLIAGATALTTLTMGTARAASDTDAGVRAHPHGDVEDTHPYAADCRLPSLLA